MTSSDRSAAATTRANPLVWALAGFVVLSMVYYGWMSGGTFSVSELSVFPNYNMLAKSFLQGRLDLADNPPEDYSLFASKKYLYFGPVPALLRLPFLLIGWEISTGFMVALLAAGTWAVFLLILICLNHDHTQRPLGPLQVAFAVMFALNGFSLWMVSVPSIHHEAICAATFFLLLGIYFVLKAARNSYTLSINEALIIGLSLALSLGSRFSYVLTVFFLVAFLFRGIWRERGEGNPSRSLAPFTIMLGTMAAGMGLLLAYNFARFGSLTEFGMKYATSLYSDYLRQGLFFRYDHIPYNLWSYIFYIPEGNPHFPYVKLPFYILKVESVSGLPYALLNVNELCASVFCFFPVLLFCFVPLFKRATNPAGLRQSALKLFVVVFALQLLPLCMSMAAITRYYYDFLPMMMLIALFGIERVQEEFTHKNLTLTIIVVTSILFSFAVTVNAVRFYEVFCAYRSPLLRFF
ncbi:MAG: hypothetical protein HY913_03050 [Desulfomonile tiedjei]|nr:hypothetical protein [Desulfomonile tiedjei]